MFLRKKENVCSVQDEISEASDRNQARAQDENHITIR